MRKIKALVIDDSRVMRMMVMKSLNQTQLAEFEFVEAEDGADGLTKLSANRPNIVFVDWNMPKMTGIDFVRQARASTENDTVPLVMVTSEKAMGKVMEAIDQAGANGYICKPFTVEEMNQKLSPIFAKMEEKGGLFSKLIGG